MKDNAMAPRFRAGEVLYVESARPAVPGNDVVVRLRDGAGYVRRFLAKTPAEIMTDTCQPEGKATFATAEVEGLHVIVGVARIDT